MAQREESALIGRRDIFIPVLDETLRPRILGIAQELRKNDHVVSVYPAEAKFKNQLKFASESGYRWVLILGENEFSSAVATVKDFQNGSEEKVDLSNLSGFFSKISISKT
jgi:histidyl-tRNA synthetase